MPSRVKMQVRGADAPNEESTRQCNKQETKRVQCNCGKGHQRVSVVETLVHKKERDQVYALIFFAGCCSGMSRPSQRSLIAISAITTNRVHKAHELTKSCNSNKHGKAQVPIRRSGQRKNTRELL